MNCHNLKNVILAVMRLELSIDNNQKLIALVKTMVGRFALCIIAILLMGIRFDDLIWITFIVVTAAGYAYAPQRYQAFFLFIVAQFFVVYHTLTDDNNFYEFIQLGSNLEGLGGVINWAFFLIAWFGVLIFTWGGVVICRRLPQSFLARWPVLTILVIDFLLLFLWSEFLSDGYVRFGVLLVLITYSANLWFIAYAFLDQRNARKESLLFHGGLTPLFWAQGSNLPMGKGAIFLRKFSSNNDEELAVTQLKGVKLLAWGGGTLWCLYIFGVYFC